LRALIFDMDGTLTDSDRVHIEAFRRALEPHGIPMSDERYRTTISGRTNAEIARGLFPHESTDFHARFSDEKESLFRALATAMEPLEGLLDLLAWAEGRGLALALVTNAPAENARHTLRALRLEGRFPVTIAGEDAERAKPDPMPYRMALARLGLDPSQAVAFEDSVPGIRSAKGAGLPVFGVTTSHPEEVLREAGADAAIGGFADPGLLDWLAARTAG
jgi:beta-phosphoglucomutase